MVQVTSADLQPMKLCIYQNLTHVFYVGLPFPQAKEQLSSNSLLHSFSLGLLCHCSVAIGKIDHLNRGLGSLKAVKSPAMPHSLVLRIHETGRSKTD